MYGRSQSLVKTRASTTSEKLDPITPEIVTLWENEHSDPKSSPIAMAGPELDFFGGLRKSSLIVEVEQLDLLVDYQPK
jgi:hypothetical protein